MKKLNKKVLGISLGISSLLIVAPSILTSCSTNEVKEFPNPDQIIDFSKYQSYVYVSDKEDLNWDPFSPKYKGQELYQFQYILNSAMTDEQFNEINSKLRLESYKHEGDNMTYFVRRDFRDQNLLKQIFSSLTYELSSSKNTNLSKPAPLEKDPKFQLTKDGIFFDKILNENLVSIVRTRKTVKGTKSLTWYVYPKKGKDWNVDVDSTKNAYFSINIY